MRNHQDRGSRGHENYQESGWQGRETTAHKNCYLLNKVATFALNQQLQKSQCMG